MKMQWDKISERIHSESLKCLFCYAMERMLRKIDDFKDGFTFCCSLMVVALTMDDDGAFENEAKLAQALSCKRDIQGPISEDEITFVTEHKEYFFEWTLHVLKKAKDCPDKPYNRRRSDAR